MQPVDRATEAPLFIPAMANPARDAGRRRNRQYISFIMATQSHPLCLGLSGKNWLWLRERTKLP